MDEVFKRFIEKAKRHGLCKEYTDKVESAESKRAFMDIVLDANGMEWMCNAIAKWNALTPEYIADAFAPFNDGKYTPRPTGIFITDVLRHKACNYAAYIRSTDYQQ